MNAQDTPSPSGNITLSSAKAAKQDEFYTQLPDIANELKHYKGHLRNKVILCNCDDPFESNFFKYFAANFNTLGLKKLIATTYEGSPIVGRQLPLFELEGLKPKAKEPYLVEINEVHDTNRDGAINLDDVAYLLRHDKNATRPLKGSDTYSGGEPPREKWRLQAVRGWSNDTTGEVSSGDSRTGGAPCPRAPGRVPVAVGGDQLDRCEVRNDAGDAAQMGAAG